MNKIKPGNRVVTNPEPRPHTGKGEDMRERFVLEFCKDFNATQAAIRSGYSPKTARAQGCRLLTKVDIQKKLIALKSELAGEARLEAQKFFNKMNLLMDFDPNDCYENGIAKDMDDIPKNTRICLESYKMSSRITNGTDANGKPKQDAFAESEIKFPRPLAVAIAYGQACGVAVPDEDAGKTLKGIQLTVRYV